MFAIFDDLNVFDTWHSAIKIELGYPIYGKNEQTGEIDKTHAITEFTVAKINPDDPRVIAWVGTHITNLEIISPDNPLWVGWFPVQEHP